jgi:hypothetical protein
MIDLINWQTVCLNIRRHYKPLSQVAKEVKSDWKHLNRLARGETEQPKFKVAIRLLDIHHDHCPDRHNMKELAL